MRLAFDKATNRTKDEFGRMRVDVSNISKGCVNPYRGNEIPNFENLGLTPDRVYYLLRDPAELAKAADTFNNLPLLDRHLPTSADEPQKDFIIGSTGTDASFDEPYLRNSLIVWEAKSIARIEAKAQCELSCSYAYEAEMTPGIFGGQKYDGIMRNIRGNHVALVEKGRAGPDVLVGDSKLLEKPPMKLSANARAVRSALLGYLTPALAMDSQIGDLTSIVADVKSIKPAKTRKAIVSKVKAAYDGKLAEDANLDGLDALLVTLANDEEDETADDEEDEPKKADDEKDEDDDKVPKSAMDSAIRLAEDSVVSRMKATRQAEIDVQPLIGTIALAQDSAAAVYKLALDHAGVDTVGVPEAAYGAMVGMLKKQASIAPPPKKLANDSQSNGASLFASVYTAPGKSKGGV